MVLVWLFWQDVCMWHHLYTDGLPAVPMKLLQRRRGLTFGASVWVLMMLGELVP